MTLWKLVYFQRAFEPLKLAGEVSGEGLQGQFLPFSGRRGLIQ